MDDQVLVERAGPIATVTLNRPAKLNAIDNAMWERLADAFTGFDADPALRCVVIRGAGGKAFSVGADIGEFEENRSTIGKARAYHERTHAAMATITGCRHPVIAGIDGLCVGGGLELAATCDLRIATERSRFGIPIKRLGLVVSYAELKPLVDLIGPASAMEILLEGQVFEAAQALRIGLVNRLVPDAGLDAEIDATAARIAEGAPLVARWHKKFTRRVLEPEPITPTEQDECFECFETEDFRTGYQAFLAKTKPRFEGR
jgi:enoyl-CoA hydratase